jgi:uncharacterized LabA/DUF88 family protein
MPTPNRTYIYIDGFNLYYGALKRSPYKWLDLKKLCCALMNPKHNILKIKYFTARVSGKLDPNKQIRQNTYVRALKHFIPEVEIHYGHFLTHVVRAPLANTQPYEFVNIEKTEEKGSDVNLAVHLLNDARPNLYDCAVIISNDRDLAEACRLVKHQNRKMLGVITPDTSPSTHPLTSSSGTLHIVARIRNHVLALCQLPDVIPGTGIHKPSTW